MAVSAFVTVAATSAVLTPSNLGFVILVSVATLGHGGWTANIMTLPGDMGPRRLVGTLCRVTGLGGGLGSILERSFIRLFVIFGVLPLIALVIFLLLTGKIELSKTPTITGEVTSSGWATVPQ
jgi:hypothetical protein